MKTNEIRPDARYVANNGKHYQIVKTASGKYCGSELQEVQKGLMQGTGRGVFFSSQRHAVPACEAHSTQSEAVFTYQHQTDYRTVGTRRTERSQGAAA